MSSTEQQQRETVVATARSWLRTPYHHAARVKGAGVDCAMLLAEVYAEAGLIPRVEPEPYPPDWHLHRDRDRFLEWVNRFGQPTQDPKPGDLAMYRFGRASSHGAIIVNWPEIIHAVRYRGVTLDTGESADLASRFVGFWTLWPKAAAAEPGHSEPDEPRSDTSGGVA
jgi:cell wall-associated NlpC family hydrolase